MKTVAGASRNRIESLDELFNYFMKMHKQDFWGEVIVKFKNGVPCLIKEIRQIKLKPENE